MEGGLQYLEAQVGKVATFEDVAAYFFEGPKGNQCSFVYIKLKVAGQRLLLEAKFLAEPAFEVCIKRDEPADILCCKCVLSKVVKSVEELAYVHAINFRLYRKVPALVVLIQIT